MKADNNLTNYIEATIAHWVGKNFGSQELDDPSWNIRALSEYLAKELAKRKAGKDVVATHELTVLFRTDANISNEVTKVKEAITFYGGKIVSEENDGEKRLAYPIQDEKFATYYYFDVMLPKQSVARLAGSLNINDGVLRYLLVSKDTRGR